MSVYPDAADVVRIYPPTAPCRVCGTPATRYLILVGGEWVEVAFCGPHGAEYRIDEAEGDTDG